MLGQCPRSEYGIANSACLSLFSAVEVPAAVATDILGNPNQGGPGCKHSCGQHCASNWPAVRAAWRTLTPSGRPCPPLHPCCSRHLHLHLLAPVQQQCRRWLSHEVSPAPEHCRLAGAASPVSCRYPALVCAALPWYLLKVLTPPSARQLPPASYIFAASAASFALGIAGAAVGAPLLVGEASGPAFERVGGLRMAGACCACRQAGVHVRQCCLCKCPS